MRYSFDVTKARAMKRKAYEYNLEGNRAMKRIKYAENKNNNCERKRKYYASHKLHENNRIREFYKCNPKNKKICNEKYYKKHKNYIKIMQKKSLANRISWKYKRMYVKANKIGFIQSIEIYIKILLKNMKATEITAQRIEAEQIIKWCIHTRDNYVSLLRKTLSLLNNKVTVSLDRIPKCSTSDIIFNNNHYTQALCGLCKHTSTTESYFFETAYKFVEFHEPLIINENGQVINILPITKKCNKRKKIEWQCGSLCKGNELFLINRFKDFLIAVSKCSVVRNIPKLIKSIGIRTVKQSSKLGHKRAT